MFPQFSEVKFGHVNLELRMNFSTLNKFEVAGKDFNIFLGIIVRWLNNDNVI